MMKTAHETVSIPQHVCTIRDPRLANGVLHGIYHVHQPSGIPGSVISCAFLYAFPSWRFQSTWLGIIVHSVQGVYFSFLILGIVLGWV